MKISICSLCRDSLAKESLYQSLINCFPNTTEYILIDNSSKKIDCYQALNIFIDQCNGDYILVCHDDILFENLEYEYLLNQITKKTKSDPSASLFGVAGVSRSNKNIGHFFDAKGERYWGMSEGDLASSLDEFFLVIRKNSGLSVSDGLKGYHFYGTDLCLNAKEKGLSCYVIDFPVTHYSTGNMNGSFFEARDDFEKHLQKKGLKQFITTTCTVLYGGSNPLKQAWALALSLDLIERANHIDLEDARKSICYRADKRYGKTLFQLLLYIIKTRFKIINLFRRFKSDLLWWRKNWRARVAF